MPVSPWSTASARGRPRRSLAAAAAPALAADQHSIGRLDAAKANLEKDTTLTAAQKTQILADLEARTKDLVENGKPAGKGGGRHGGHGGPRGGFGAAA